jgi:hypothetical protein
MERRYHFGGGKQETEKTGKNWSILYPKMD